MNKPLDPRLRDPQPFTHPDAPDTPDLVYTARAAIEWAHGHADAEACRVCGQVEPRDSAVHIHDPDCWVGRLEDALEARVERREGR